MVNGFQETSHSDRDGAMGIVVGQVEKRTVK